MDKETFKNCTDDHLDPNGSTERKIMILCHIQDRHVYGVGVIRRLTTRLCCK